MTRAFMVLLLLAQPVLAGERESTNVEDRRGKGDPVERKDRKPSPEPSRELRQILPIPRKLKTDPVPRLMRTTQR
jgi:hypothetical protein